MPTTADEMSMATGIACVLPKLCEGHKYRKSVAMGKTEKSPEEVLEILLRLKPKWPMWRYDILTRNCQTFCAEFCLELGVGPIPEWVSKLVHAVAAVNGATKAACCLSDDGVAVVQTIPPEEIMQDENRG